VKLRHVHYQLGVPLHAVRPVEVNELGELVESWAAHPGVPRVVCAGRAVPLPSNPVLDGKSTLS
jgi:hypothetical protein